MGFSTCYNLSVYWCKKGDSLIIIPVHRESRDDRCSRLLWFLLLLFVLLSLVCGCLVTTAQLESILFSGRLKGIWGCVTRKTWTDKVPCDDTGISILLIEVRLLLVPCHPWSHPKEGWIGFKSFTTVLWCIIQKVNPTQFWLEMDWLRGIWM